MCITKFGIGKNRRRLRHQEVTLMDTIKSMVVHHHVAFFNRVSKFRTGKISPMSTVKNIREF
jgi:hypothetical protein